MSKQAAKSELQKLKTLTDTTEVWSRRVHKFWKSTADICLAASESLHADSSSTGQLRTQLKDASESACKCVENVKDVAQHRLIELSRSLQEKTKSKQRDVCCKQLGRQVEAASVEISTAIFSTFHNQADQLDLLLEAIVAFERHQLDKASGDTSMGRESLESKKRDVSSDENNVELDWDAFDRDLAAVANVVDKMGNPDPVRESEEIQKLKRQLKKTQRENGELMKRAILAEHALGNSEREKSELIDRMDTGFNHDDFLEVRKALKQEQVARLDAEQRLKDAQEEIKAAQFAYKVAKAVANRIADSAEITQGGLLRCQSERQIPGYTHPIIQAASVGTNDLATASESDHEMPVARTDSAYYVEDTRDPPDDHQDFCGRSPSPEAVPAHPIQDDIPEEPDQIHSNPFMMEDVKGRNPCPNPFLQPDNEISNPFLVGEDESFPGEQVEETRESDSTPFEASNPFLSKPKADDQCVAEWNPFVSNNPFLS